MATFRERRSLERTKRRDAFLETPKDDMGPCCNWLRIFYDSQVHKSLVRAIVHITRYGKQFIHDDGKIAPRVPGSTNFSTEFQDLVDKFLLELKAGIIFFPQIIPDYSGWESSYWPNRLQWNNTEDRKDIRGAILLMFEAIKFNGATIDVSDSEVFGSFDTDDCDDCGGVHCTDDNDIVFCDTCRTGHHQKCYNIPELPPNNTPWFCRTCLLSRQEHSYQKARGGIRGTERSGSEEYICPTEGARDFTIHSEDEPAGKRARISIRQLPEDQHSILGSKTSALNQPHEVVGHALPRPAIVRSRIGVRPLSEKQQSVELILTIDQLENTILLTSLRDELIYRATRMSNIGTTEGLFRVCSQRWPEKFGKGRLSRLLLYLPDDLGGGYMEITASNKEDFIEFLKIVRREWIIQGCKTVYVRMMLLAEEEVLNGE